MDVLYWNMSEKVPTVQVFGHSDVRNDVMYKIRKITKITKIKDFRRILRLFQGKFAENLVIMSVSGKIYMCFVLIKQKMYKHYQYLLTVAL